MFGGKKASTSTKGKKIIPTATSHALNSIVQGSSVRGDITADNDIRIDGKLDGTLNCTSKVIVGPTGSIKGDVRCENAVIEGHTNGTLHVKALLHIKESAKVEGEVHTNKIIIQSGAVFNVSCQMGPASLKKEKPNAQPDQKKLDQAQATV